MAQAGLAGLWSRKLPRPVSPPTPELSRWFTEQIQPHEPKLRAWLRARFPQLDDLDDLVQDTYLRLFRTKGEGKFEQPKAYLYTTARNAALDRCRRRQIVSFAPITELPTLDVPEDAPDASAVSDLHSKIDVLASALETLPKRCREVLILRKHYGLSHKEIAEKLGISTNTVNAQITLGMFRCRAYFRDNGLLDEHGHFRS